jgi:hypothetical protein
MQLLENEFAPGMQQDVPAGGVGRCLVAMLPANQREAKLAELDERLQDLRDSVVDGHGLRLDGIAGPHVLRAGLVRRLGRAPRADRTSRTRPNFRASGVLPTRRVPIGSQRP